MRLDASKLPLRASLIIQLFPLVLSDIHRVELSEAGAKIGSLRDELHALQAFSGVDYVPGLTKVNDTSLRL